MPSPGKAIPQDNASKAEPSWKFWRQSLRVHLGWGHLGKALERLLGGLGSLWGTLWAPGGYLGAPSGDVLGSLGDLGNP